MALPVAAQGYMPNPLLYAQASQMGLDYGQDIIQGGLTAADTLMDIAGKGQNLTLEPIRVETQRRQQEAQQAYQEATIDLGGRQEDRLGVQQSLNEDERMRRYELDKEKNRIDALNAGRVSFQQARAEREFAEQEMLQSTIGEFVQNDNLDPLMVSAGKSGQSWGNFAANISKKGNEFLRQGFVEKATNALNDPLSDITPEQRDFLQDSISSLESKAKRDEYYGNAQKGRNWFEANMNLKLQPGDQPILTPNVTKRGAPIPGQFQITVQKPGEAKPRWGGIAIATSPEEQRSLHNAIMGINQENAEVRVQQEQRARKDEERRQRATDQGIQAYGGAKIQESVNPQVVDEQPTKGPVPGREPSPTPPPGPMQSPTMRQGDARANVPPESEAPAVRQTQKDITAEQQNRARMNALLKAGNVEIQPDRSPLEVMKSAATFGATTKYKVVRKDGKGMRKDLVDRTYTGRPQDAEAYRQRERKIDRKRLDKMAVEQRRKELEQPLSAAPEYREKTTGRNGGR